MKIISVTQKGFVVEHFFCGEKEYKIDSEMTCNNTFEFQKRNNEEAPAIWLKLNDRYVKIDPLTLYGILWHDSKQCFFASGIEATFYISHDSVFGSFHDMSRKDYNAEFQKDLFIKSATQSLTELCNASIAGKYIAYRNLNQCTAEQMLIGLDELTSRTNETKVEHFSFDFVRPYSCDTDFVIQIGGRKYKSALSDWTTDFNLIRLEIEQAILWRQENADIRLHFEDSPTIIRLHYHHLRDIPEQMADVTIIPDTFQDVPRVYGLCSQRQLIRALYLGLLKISITEVGDNFDTYFGEWKDIRLAIYNKLQSCAIENYIKGIEEDELTFMPRQRFITSVEEMKADYQRLQNELKM